MTDREHRRRKLARFGHGFTLCVLLLASAAFATGERRVAIVNPDAELDHAVALALSPWAVEVVVKSDEPPGTTLPSAGEKARSLALEWGVTAVIWLSSDPQGSLLWIYETDTDSVSTRSLSTAPPFSSSNAASVALTIKSLLRLTEPRSPEPDPEAATLTAPSPAEVSVQPPPAPAPEPALPRERLTLSAKLALRYVARDIHDPRGALSAVWWLGEPEVPVGVLVEAGAGPGASIQTERFSGQFRQLSLSGALLWRVVGNRHVATTLLTGASVHHVELSGFDRQRGDAAEYRRLAPSLDAGTEIAFALPSRTSLGFGVKALYFPSYERYLARGTTVLETWPIAAEFGARFGVDLL